MISQGVKLEQLFKNFLALKKGGGNHSSETPSFGEIFGNQKLSLKANGTFSALKNATGKEFLNNVKGHLQNLGLNPEQVSVGTDSLDALKKIMRGRGVGQEEINSLFAQLQPTSSDNKIKLSDLFAKISELNETLEEEELNLLLPSSAVPFLQSILPMLGLDDETMESALSYSKTQSGNINVERLVSFLRGLSSQTADSNQLPDHLSQMMKSIGIPAASDERKPLSLSQFTSRLERMIYQNSSRAVSDTQFQQDLDGFFNSLKVDGVFSNNSIFTEKLTRLRSTDPLEATNFNPKGKNTLFAGIENSKTGFFKSESSGPHIDAGMNRENQIPGKTISSFFADTGDKNNGSALKSSMQELFGETLSKQKIKHNPGSGIENELAGSTKKEATAEASTRTNAEKPLPSYVLNQVSKQIIRSFQDGLNEIRLQLKPPHLGRLQIHLKNINDGLKVSILAENSTTQEMLKTHTSELKAALLEHGIRLDKIDVQVSFNFEQSMSQAKQDSRKSPNKKQPIFNLEENGEIPGTRTSPHHGTMLWQSSRRLDLVA